MGAEDVARRAAPTVIGDASPIKSAEGATDGRVAVGQRAAGRPGRASTVRHDRVGQVSGGPRGVHSPAESRKGSQPRTCRSRPCDLRAGWGRVPASKWPRGTATPVPHQAAMHCPLPSAISTAVAYRNHAPLEPLAPRAVLPLSLLVHCEPLPAHTLASRYATVVLMPGPATTEVCAAPR